MSPDTRPSVLRFENVTVSFDGEPAVRDISFEAREGESRIVLGEHALNRGPRGRDTPMD